MTRITSLAISTVIFWSCAYGCFQGNDDSGSHYRSEYLIPDEYSPEPGVRDSSSGATHINSMEFSFELTGAELANAIPGFDDGLYGISHDFIVVVQVYDEDVHGKWKPDARELQRRREFWEMTGYRSTACIADDRESVTGYYRYYLYCDPKPHINSGFYLLDRRPTSDSPVPADMNYIRGTCHHEPGRQSDESQYFTQCRFRRNTDWKDQFSFWLSGDNLAFLSEVELLIAGKLDEWRLEN